jgi:epidermal growth factor receptor substrate 15
VIRAGRRRVSSEGIVLPSLPLRAAMSKTFAPTPQELALVAQIFNKADPQKLGIITGDVAVDVFSSSKLSPTVLGEVWQIADSDNQGFLTRKGTAIALRLIGHAQKGETVTEALVNKRTRLFLIAQCSV